MTAHVTEQGCSVRVRVVGESVEVVLMLRDGRARTFACSQDDALAIGMLLVRAVPRDNGADLPELPEALP